MKPYLLSLLMLFPFGLSAQSDTFSTSQGELPLHPVLHASMVWEWNGQTLYFDPYGGAERYEAFPAPHPVLITHPHGDHLNPETLGGLDLSGAEWVAPQSVVDKMEKDLKAAFSPINLLANGETYAWNGAEIEAVPMHNLPDDETARHSRGWGNAYVLTLAASASTPPAIPETFPKCGN